MNKQKEEIRKGFIVVIKNKKNLKQVDSLVKSILKNKIVDYIQATVILKEK